MKSVDRALRKITYARHQSTVDRIIQSIREMQKALTSEMWQIVRSGSWSKLQQTRTDDLGDGIKVSATVLDDGDAFTLEVSCPKEGALALLEVRLEDGGITQGSTRSSGRGPTRLVRTIGGAAKDAVREYRALKP